ncbi:MAG: FGGY-family carbohydrate kinase [Pleurocapsa sp.]
MYYLGIDFGTSGARGIVIDQERQVITQVKNDFVDVSPTQLISIWQKTLATLILQIPLKIRRQIKAIAINGTSSTVLLCDALGTPITTPILYNDNRGKSKLTEIGAIAPADSVVISATSSLAKLWWWYEQSYFANAVYFLHQADWLAFLLHGQLGISDYHNALKLGYNLEKFCYPTWLQDLPFAHLYPQVLSPGTPVATVTPTISDRFQLASDCLVCTGTTDSIAAFIASGANQPGEAVTSLGSTLVLKLLSQTKISAPQYGIYSHRLGNLWLAGGASNTGGAVLKHFFDPQQLTNLSQQIDPNSPSPLEYYPLLSPGDRFPINDPHLLPQLDPRPQDDIEFLHGLLESLSRIETLGYQKLQELGANKLTKVYTAGGGAKNLTWQKMRQRYLGVPVVSALYTAAAYGTALLASSQLDFSCPPEAN